MNLISGSKTTETSKEQPYYIKETGEYIEKLVKRKVSLEESRAFSAGDIVIWKDGLKNKRFPDYGQPAIVIGFFQPAITESDAIAAVETFDIKLGFIDEDDEFLVFPYDSKRFTTFKKG